MLRKELLEEMQRLKENIVASCQTCQGSGYLDPVEPGVINPCKCMTVLHYLNALVEAKIPRDYWWLRLDDLEIDEKYKMFIRWYLNRLGKAVNNALGVLFLGTNGIGKTSMMCEIGKEAVVRGYKVQYFTAQQYIEARKIDSPLYREYEDAQLTLLDEVDKVYIKTGSNFVAKTLEDFLRRQSSSGVAFVICTNYDAATLSSVFGQSTISMLKRHLKFVDVRGSDYSDTLQDQWTKMMDAETDYYAPSIWEMAEKMMQREIKEESRAWTKANRK